MSAPHPLLPALAAGHHWVGFWGALISVPDDWNLHAYRGEAKAGMLVFADLRQVRLELRWRPLRRHDRPPSGELSPTPGREGGMAAHVHDRRRAYELHFPRQAAEPALMRRLVDEFRRSLAPLADTAGDQEWFWSIYGAQGWVDRRARLLQASLLPGATRLHFRLPGLRPRWLRLGSFSRADQLRSDDDNLSLPQLALSLMPELRTLKDAQWTDQGDDATLQARSLLWPLRRWHRASFHHDGAANTIRWRHDSALGQYNSPGVDPSAATGAATGAASGTAT